MMNKPNAESPKKRLNGGLPPADVVQDGIALRLRELYSNIENEGIPDNLLNLLEKLDEAERAQTGGQTPEV
ncbi:MAG TPA: NepR family anti-sigma factor [Ensifer sp.]|nr:NepR family anti-sigma factor [Ensifer sp.]